MRVGILTHPMVNNYGGILQGLALKTVLLSMGHSVVILDRRPNFPGWKVKLKQIIGPVYSRVKHLKRLENHAAFIANNFNRTPPIHSHHKLLKTIRDYNLDAIVIGSDQVWNAKFSNQSDFDYWGDYEGCNIKVLSYAASMGIPVWEYDEQATQRIKKNLSDFSGISVREFHIIPLLEEIGVQNIKWVLDPTLLLDSEFYSGFISDNSEDKSPFVFIYWMGDENLIPDIPENYAHCRIIKCNLSDIQNELPIESWLSYIKNAELVITNSFHGSAFSIIFNKHFIPFVNKNYVDSRFISLFSSLELKEKLSNPYVEEDYLKVNEALTKARQESISFLKNSLGNNNFRVNG